MKNNHFMKKEGYRTALLFNAPLLLGTALFILFPVVGTLATSFFRDVTFLPVRFLAFANYARLLGDPHFWNAAQFTLLFIIVSVSAELFLGLAFALLLNEVIPGRSLLRVGVLIPWAIPVAISARIWEWMFNFDHGLFNTILLGIGVVQEPVSWLGSPTSAFFAIVVSDVWKTVPFMAIILLAGLSVIDDELYHQARVDGATVVQRFLNITLPLLRPVLAVALLFRTIDAIRIFDLIYVLTGGGPGGSTTSLSLYAYNYFAAGDMGYGSAIAVIIFVFAVMLSVAYIRLGGFRENVE